jgi:hypothetical protein
MADVGFGWSLYGFFAAALVWLAVYFYWAWRAAERDRARDESRGQDVHGR